MSLPIIPQTNCSKTDLFSLLSKDLSPENINEIETRIFKEKLSLQESTDLFTADIRKALPLNVTIKTFKERSFRINRLWLAAQSHFFETSIAFHPEQKFPDEYFIKDLDAYTILEKYLTDEEQVLNNINSQNVFILYNTAQFFGLKKLTERIQKFLIEYLKTTNLEQFSMRFFDSLKVYDELHNIYEKSILDRLGEWLDLFNKCRANSQKEPVRSPLPSPEPVGPSEQIHTQDQRAPHLTEHPQEIGEPPLTKANIKKILKCISQPIPVHISSQLSAPQLGTLFALIPNKMQALSLSNYSDFEIEQLAPQIPLYVKELNLAGTALSDDTIFHITQHCKLLERLNLAHAVKWNKKDPLHGSQETWQDLASLSHLKSLDVTGCPGIAPSLELIIMQSPELQELRMGKCADDIAWGDRCASWLKRFCPLLKIFEIDGKNMSEEGLQQLSTLPIHSLTLTDCENLTPKMTDLITAFSHLKCLKLSFQENVLLDSKTSQEVVKKLLSLSHLEKFALIGQSPFLGGECFRQEDLLNFAVRNPSLRFLDLTNCFSISDQNVRALITCPHLQSLKLRGNYLSFNGINQLLHQNLNLFELETDTKLNDDELYQVTNHWKDLRELSLALPVQNLSIGLDPLTHLKKLSLSINSSDILSKLVKACPDISSLQLTGTLLSETDVQEFKALKHLRMLSFSANACLKKDYYQFLQQLPLLEKLEVNTNEVNLQLLNSITSFATQLKSLKLNTNEQLMFDLTQGEWALITQQFKKLNHLKLVNLPINQDMIQALLDHIPRLSSLRIDLPIYQNPIISYAFFRGQEGDIQCRPSIAASLAPEIILKLKDQIIQSFPNIPFVQ